MLRRLCQVVILTVGNIKINFDSWKKCLFMWLFLEWFIGNSKSSDGINIDQNWKDTNLFEVMNFRQVLNLSIFRKHATSIKICTISNNTSLVDITVSSSMSVSKLRDHLYFSFQLSTLTVRSWRIDKNLCTIKCSINHGVIWNPTFLTNLICHWSIIKLNNEDSNWNFSLSCNVLNSLRKFEISNTTFTVPWCKLSGLKVIISICKDHFGSDSDNFVIVHQYSCIVESCFMEHRASNINDNTLSYFALQNVFDNIPRVINGIILLIMVMTTISTDF